MVMRRYALQGALLAACLAFFTQSGLGVSKEMIQMMTQLDNLQQQVMNLQNTVATQTAILKTLVQQANQSLAEMKTTIGKMRDAQEKSLANSSNQIDSLSGQVQQLSASLDEAKGEIGKLGAQLAQTQKMMQTLNAPQPAPQGTAGSAPAGTSAAGNPPANDGANQQDAGVQAPNPQVLYDSAYADYTQGQYPLAIQGFRQYVQVYGDTDLASNAQFYIGDSYFLEKQYQQALKEFDACIQNYPNGNKAAAALLKKGYSQLALGQKTSAEQELALVIRNYPGTHEADLARERLRSLREQTRP